MQPERDRIELHLPRPTCLRTVPLPEPAVQRTAARAPPKPITSAPSAITAPLVRFIVSPSSRRIFYRIVAGGATSAARRRAAAGEAARWVAGADAPLTFAACCEALGIPAAWLRARIPAAAGALRAQPDTRRTRHEAAAWLRAVG